MLNEVLCVNQDHYLTLMNLKTLHHLFRLLMNLLVFSIYYL